jgi:hypothetical protein
MECELFFNDIWTLYFHDPYDANWTNSSYINLGQLSNVDDFWNHHTCNKDNISKGMFFLMREHIFPCWDDPCNISGGCISIKVLKEDMSKFWEDLCVKMLSETLLVPEHQNLCDSINGVSTSPKKHFCIIKIWLKDDTLNNKKYFDILPMYHGDVLYKSNRDNINNDTNKAA